MTKQLLVSLMEKQVVVAYYNRGADAVKNKSHKGFTLLEMVVALLLFGFVLEMLWFLYNSIYINNLKFETNSELTESIRIVSSTIKDEIRLTDEVSIVIEQEDGTPILLLPDTQANHKGSLQAIYLNNPTNSDLGQRSIKVIATQDRQNNQGPYSLVYELEDGETAIISDKIASIEVTQVENSPNLYFDCQVESGGGTKMGEVLTLDGQFSESIQYKNNSNDH